MRLLAYRILLIITAQTVINIKIPPFGINDAISKLYHKTYLTWLLLADHVSYDTEDRIIFP